MFRRNRADRKQGLKSAAPGAALETPAAADWRAEEHLCSAEILAQAQWLYEQHERRAQNSQNQAIAILTIVGTIMAIVPNGVPEGPQPWHYVALGVVAVTGLVTMAQCLRVLVPRTRSNALPDVGAFREIAHRYEKLGASGVTIPVTQFATEMLNATKLTEPSPLTQASEVASRRVDALSHVYLWFAATFGLVIAMNLLFSLVK